MPTVAVHTDIFANLARSAALATGMPTTRQAFVPQPIVGRTPAELHDYVTGLDPVSARPFMQEVIEALSHPLNDNDITGLTFERDRPRLLQPDTEDNLQALFRDSHWCDNLPVILPTEERVERMLQGTSRGAQEIVGRLQPAAFREFWEFSVEKVAVNAVMAGAQPEYLPVILALAASGISARSSSTTSFATISLVNGPIRGEIGMNDGIGVMGPYSHANTSIGRAHNLLSVNLQGGSVPGDTYMGSMGNWYNFSATFAEAEERSPWEPFHVQKGFKPADSIASVFFGGWYTQSGYGPRETWQDKMRRALVACEQYVPPILVMDPSVARAFVELGFESKEKLAEWCSQASRLPARAYWDDQWMQTLRHPLAVAGVEPWAGRLKAAPDELVPMFEPDEISIVVAGGETQGAWKLIAGACRAQVSIDDWR